MLARWTSPSIGWWNTFDAGVPLSVDPCSAAGEHAAISIAVTAIEPRMVQILSSSCCRHRFDDVEHRRRVPPGSHLLEHVADDSVAVDHEGRAQDAVVPVPEELLLSPRSVRLRNRVVLVGQQRKRQPAPGAEALV